MIEAVITWSMRNRFMVLLVAAFAVLGGILAMQETPLDAIPDLSDVQVIIYTKYPGQAPRVVEDQVTYPLTTAMLSVPYAKVVAGLFLLRFFLRLHPVRGRHRHLLGAIARPGIPQLRRRTPAHRGHSQPGARRHWRGLGVRIRVAGHHRHLRPAGTAQPAGLVPALRTHVGAWRLRGRQHRRLCEAVSG